MPSVLAVTAAVGKCKVRQSHCRSDPESPQMVLLALLGCVCQGHPRKQRAGIELVKLAARQEGLTVHLERLIYAQTPFCCHSLREKKLSTVKWAAIIAFP